MLPGRKTIDDNFYLSNSIVSPSMSKLQGRNFQRNNQKLIDIQKVHQQPLNAQNTLQSNFAKDFGVGKASTKNMYNPNVSYAQGVYAPNPSQQYVGVQNNIYLQQNVNHVKTNQPLNRQDINKIVSPTQNTGKNLQNFQDFQNYYKK